MKCPNCGKEIPDDSLYCEYCGYKIEKNPIETQNANKKFSIFYLVKTGVLGILTILVLLFNMGLYLFKLYYIILFGFQYANINLSRFHIQLFDTSLMKNVYLYPVYAFIMIFVYISLFSVWRSSIRTNDSDFAKPLFSKVMYRLFYLVLTSAIAMLIEAHTSNFYGHIYPPDLEFSFIYYPFISAISAYFIIVLYIYYEPLRRAIQNVRNNIDFSSYSMSKEISENSKTLNRLSIKESINKLLSYLFKVKFGSLLIIFMSLDTAFVILDTVYNSFGNSVTHLLLLFDILEIVGIYLFWISASDTYEEYPTYSVLNNMGKALLFVAIIQAMYLSIVANLIPLLYPFTINYIVMTISPVISYLIVTLLKYSELTRIKREINESSS